METIRAFIAIELSDEIRASLASLQNELKRGGQRFINWVDPIGIHLTLKFLGNVESQKVPQIIDAVAAVAGKTSPFKLWLEKLGIFPNLKRPRVIWVGTTGELETLLQLQKDIENALLPLGFAKESRRYTAHLTLARVRQRTSSEELQRLVNAIGATEYKCDRDINVDSISLMRSRLTPAGALYSRISSIGLKGSLSNV